MSCIGIVAVVCVVSPAGRRMLPARGVDMSQSDYQDLACQLGLKSFAQVNRGLVSIVLGQVLATVSLSACVCARDFC